MAPRARFLRVADRACAEVVRLDIVVGQKKVVRFVVGRSWKVSDPCDREVGRVGQRDVTSDTVGFGREVLQRESERLANLVAIARFKRVLPADSSA